MKRVFCCVLCSLLLAVGLAGCASFPGSGKQTTTFLDVFDTVCSVTAYGVEEEAFIRQVEELHRELQRYHCLFDIYHTYEGINNLKTINDAAGGQPVSVEQEILDLLSFGVEAYTLTDGRVNVLFGPVLALWHDARTAASQSQGEGSLPSRAALQTAAGHTALSCLELDVEAGTVRLTDPQARLDVGALAKGYAAQRVADYAAEELGWDSALLDIGGNICAIGNKQGSPFTVGIRNPDTDSAVAYLHTVGISDRSVVTSGDYQRFFTVDGKTYHHIIDVDTLYPATYVRSVSIICQDSGWADVLSTALFTLPPEEGERLLEKVPGAEAVWMLTDGTVRFSQGFEVYLLS